MVVCHCKQVTKKEIVSFIRKHPGASENEVISFTKASTGCGRCRGEVVKICNETKTSLPSNSQLKIAF
ncbi:MAG TPA: (2Fe-2S)-binding protein [Prolixibacteraceae bacterium]|nr:(2Fe-2S)-binding protein [Prolixibacteraceae bacterium]